MADMKVTSKMEKDTAAENFFENGDFFVSEF